jgi:hypothetical protein
MISRRNFLTGLGAAVAAPYVIRISFAVSFAL